MQNYLNALDQWVTVIQGAIFVACVLLFRRGIVGEISAAFASAKARQSPAADAEKKSMAS
jgi:branched-chain amino acid transport system permease protein